MSESIQYIDIKRIHPNRLNPRLDLNLESLNELADSIEKVGLLQPIIVRPKNDEYEIVVGERRYRAAQQAGLVKIPTIIRSFTDEDVIELNLVENIQREELSAVEKGNSCKRLMEEFPEKYPNVQAVAERIGVSPTTINSWLPLTEAPIELQKMVAPVKIERRGTPHGSIDYTTAKSILTKIKGPKKQVEVAEALANKRGISQKVARRIIKEVAKKPDTSVNEIITKITEEPYEMPFRLDHMKPILDGTKIQTSRKGIPDPKVKEGAVIHASVWEPNFASLLIERIERKKLHNFNEDDAKREGGYTLDEFKKVWIDIHSNWDPNETVYVIHFKKVKDNF